MSDNCDIKSVKFLQSEICVCNQECKLEESTNSSIINIVNKFANKMMSKHQSVEYYKEKRNAKFPIDDIKVGKKGEFMTALYLSRQGWPVLMPDCNIRQGLGKGWDSDLPFKQLNQDFPNVHVKTCDRKTKDFAGDYSWTFQYSNKYGSGGRDDLFDRPNSDELIVFVYMDDFESCSAIVVAIAPWRLANKLLRDPISKKYLGLKKCLYHEDLLMQC